MTNLHVSNVTAQVRTTFLYFNTEIKISKITYLPVTVYLFTYMYQVVRFLFKIIQLKKKKRKKKPSELKEIYLAYPLLL